MVAQVNIDNVIFATQESVIVVGWAIKDPDCKLLLKINGVVYSNLSFNILRTDINEKYAKPADEMVGFRRTVLLHKDLLDAETVSVEVVVERRGESLASATFMVDIADRSDWKNIIYDYDNNNERVASRYYWQDNIQEGLTTVILGVYNGGEYLPAAISSVLNQTDKNIQFIIVDDASTDNTRDVLLEFEKKDSRVELVLKEHNAGQGNAFNAGILRARGDLTCMMDADDFWFANKVEKVRKTFEETKHLNKYSLYQHGLNICYGNELSHEPFRSCLLEGDILNHARKEKLRLPGPFIPTAGLAFPTHILRSIYPIPRPFRICADGYLTRTAISLGCSKTVPEPLGAYRIHNDNNTIANEDFKQEKYIANILIPTINKFYQDNKINLQLPIMERGKRSVALNKVVPLKTKKGIYYGFQSSNYAQSLEDFKDIHKGKRAFIVATGPSLQVSDLDLLKDEITFSCNKITLAFNETTWRPTYYSIIDSLVYENFDFDWSTLPSVNFFPDDLRAKYSCLKDSYFVKNRTPVYDGEKRVFEFGQDLSEGAAGGYTVIYLMMQLAFYMGIEELYLIGLDFSFNFNAVTDEKTSKGEAVIVNKGEVNHFHKDYRPSGEKWTMPRLDLQREAFSKAKEVFESNGRKIYNASRSTKLDVFERVDFTEIMAEKAAEEQNRRIVGDIYGDVASAYYSPLFEEIRVSGWVTPKPLRIDVFHKGKVVCCGMPEHAGTENGSLSSGEGIYKWAAAGEAPIEKGDRIRVVMRFPNGHSSSFLCPIEMRDEGEDMKKALKELLVRSRQLKNEIKLTSHESKNEN